MPWGKRTERPANTTCGAARAVWWTRKGALRDMRDGIEANGSVALEAALEELPSFYKARGREAHGERYIDRDGHFRSVSHMRLQLVSSIMACPMRPGSPTGDCFKLVECLFVKAVAAQAPKKMSLAGSVPNSSVCSADECAWSLELVTQVHACPCGRRVAGCACPATGAAKACAGLYCGKTSNLGVPGWANMGACCLCHKLACSLRQPPAGCVPAFASRRAHLRRSASWSGASKPWTWWQYVGVCVHGSAGTKRKLCCRRLAADHAPQDFLYVPAIHAADFSHLAHHFARYGVMAEVAMPQIIHLLVMPRRSLRLQVKIEVHAAPQGLLHSLTGCLPQAQQSASCEFYYMALIS